MENSGQLNVIKFLAPLTKDPIAPNNIILGNTPTHAAAAYGHLNIIRYLHGVRYTIHSM